MAEVRTSATEGILAEKHAAKRTEIVELLERAYWMEMETVMNYLANSANLDGIRAHEIHEVLEEDVQEELGHARAFARRIKPGSTEAVGRFRPIRKEE